MRILLGGALILVSLLAVGTVILPGVIVLPTASKQTGSDSATTTTTLGSLLAETLQTNSIEQADKAAGSALATPTSVPTPLPSPPTHSQLTLPTHYFQTFNNCGPATLAMVLNYYGENTNQTELGNRLRPYQNTAGDNDDKSVTLAELAAEAERRGYTTFHRPAGDLTLLKQLLAAELPVLTRTWTKPTEDIGHYRVITGYDDARQVIVQDDSLEGKEIAISYADFLVMWQKFNYEFLVVVEPDQAPLVAQILGELANERTAWLAAKDFAKSQLRSNPEDVTARFNLSVAEYYLGNYQEAVAAFEAVESKLLPRTLWYQLEPLLAYQELGAEAALLSRIARILDNGNRAYAELYFMRGQLYQEKGNSVAAQKEFEQALFYNKNFVPAQSALDALQN